MVLAVPSLVTTLAFLGLLASTNLAAELPQPKQGCQGLATSMAIGVSEYAEDMRDSLNLLQHAARQHLPEVSRHSDVTSGQSCVQLTSQQTYFAAPLSIGTPPQSVLAVADTGSTAIVVEDCVCRTDRHGCAPDSGCITRDHSSTLSKFDSENDFEMYYGSGSVIVKNASDVVHLGAASAFMDGDLLLMKESRMQGKISPSGILGLGIPNQAEGQGFLRKASIHSFSICFSRQQPDIGFMRLNSLRRNTTHLGQIGKEHWSLDFRGVSIGHNADTANSLGICSPHDMQHGQETPCALVPDSGSTQILAPEEHYVKLAAHICDGWPRCRQQSNGLDEDDKAVTLESLLEDCESWLPTSNGINEELPPIHFHVKGKFGQSQTLTLAAWTYVHEVMVPEMALVGHSFIKESGSSEVKSNSSWPHVARLTKSNSSFPHVTTWENNQHPTGRMLKQCKLSIGSSEFNTEINGPVWVIGLPLFYQYEVGFHLDTAPPSVSFVESHCNSCTESFSKRNGMEFFGKATSHPLRKIDFDKEPRVPHIDTTRRV